MKKVMKQASFAFARVSPRRKRKKKSRTQVHHRRRPELCPEHAVHVTLRVRDGLPAMRCGLVLGIVQQCMTAAKERNGMRIVAWTLMSNHMHLIVEAAGREALSRGMQGLKVRLARRLNRVFGRRGSVFSERYHAVQLRTGRQARNALCYVLQNAKRHGLTVGAGADPFSSGAWFTGWAPDANLRPPIGISAPCVPGRIRLLRIAWQRHGLLHPAEAPQHKGHQERPNPPAPLFDRAPAA